MTSANVTEYHVRDATGKLAHTHHQHAMCKTHYAELLRFQPLSAYTIQSSWLDEEENTHMGEIIGLDRFMRKWAEEKIKLSQRVSARGGKTFEEVLEMQIQKEFFLKDGEGYHDMARKYIASLTQPMKIWSQNRQKRKICIVTVRRSWREELEPSRFWYYVSSRACELANMHPKRPTRQWPFSLENFPGAPPLFV